MELIIFERDDSRMKKVLSILLAVVLLTGVLAVMATGAFDPTHVIYALPDKIDVVDAIASPMIPGPDFIFEIPAELSEVTIIPLKNYASFRLFDGTRFRFGKINDDTIGILTLATLGDDPTPASFIIMNAPSRFWDDWPSWAQWMLKYVFFGFIWMSF